MENKKWAIEMSGALIGQELFREAANFFHIINDSENDVVIFVSRKAYLMFEVALKCGFVINEGKKVYSDRIISKPYKPAESRFDGKRVLLVDDTVTNAFVLLDLYKRLTNPDNRYKCDNVSMFVFAINTEHKIPDEIKPYLSSHIMMTPVQLMDFSLNEAQLVHALGMVYFLELPIYHADFVSKAFFDRVEERINALHNEWKKESYEINAKTWSYEDFFLVPENEEIIPSVFPHLFEFVKYSYVKHVEADGQEESYSINFVPVKILKYIDDSFAVEFMLRLSNALPTGIYLRRYLGELLLYDWEDDATIENIHRSVTYILSYCLGIEFFSRLGLKDVEMKQVSKDAHLNDDFVSFIEGIQLSDVVTVRNILLKIHSNRNNRELPEGLEVSAQELLTSEILKTFLNQYIENDSRKSFQILMEELMKTCKDNKELPKKISINRIIAACGGNVPESVLRSVVMVMIETSVCSFSTLSYKHEDANWILKALTPGENSFTAMYNRISPKYFNAINMFKLGIGGYEQMKPHLDVFQRDCVPMLVDSGEPYINIKKMIINELSNEKLFDMYYLNCIRENTTNTFSHPECDLHAYELGEQFA